MSGFLATGQARPVDSRSGKSIGCNGQRTETFIM